MVREASNNGYRLRLVGRTRTRGKKELKPRTKPQRRSEKVEKAKTVTGESLVACLGRAAEDGGRKRSWPEGAVYLFMTVFSG